jgi:hypothetical protein
MGRISIAKVMALVAIIAVNIAAVRALHAYNEEWAEGVVLTGLAVQYATLRAIRGRGSARAFWLGFIAAGAVMMMSFIGGDPDGVSMLFRLWTGYGKYANRWLNRLTHVWDYYNRTRSEPVLVLTLAVVWSGPQLVIAVFGGLVGWFVSQRDPLPPAHEGRENGGRKDG